MTLAEAVDWVEQEIKPVTDISSGEIKRRLNLQNDYLSRELRVPSRFITGASATSAFNLPGNARPGGLMGAWLERSGERVKLRNVAKASEQMPGWFQDKGHRFVLYDPYNVTAPVTPFGFRDTDTLRILVVIKPADLVQGADEVWDGELPEHHDLVPRKVVVDILRMQTSDDMVRRAETHAHHAERQMRAAFAKSWFKEGMW